MLRLLMASFLAVPCLMVSACAQDPEDGSGTTIPDREVGDGHTYLPSDFVRFVTEGEDGHLDVAITTYRKGDVRVIFYGAVHIADRACYEELNKRFRTCDVLLYELVGPENYRPDKNHKAKGFNPIAFLQTGLKSMLQLSFQLDEIDYQADNFVHADMTPSEFRSSMEERGESLLSLIWDMMVNGQQMQREQADAAPEGSQRMAEPDLVEAFRTGEGRHLLRFNFAMQMEQIEMMAAGGDGSTLLEGRNEKCLKVLKRELQNGHDRIGIYYGAAHLPHMEKRLVEDFGFTKVKHEWLQSWDCTKRPDEHGGGDFLAKRRKCKIELRRLAKVGGAWRKVHGDGSVPKQVRALESFQQAGKPVYPGPFADPWGTDYRVVEFEKNRWRAVSAGPDKKFGNDDDLKMNEPASIFGR